MNEYLAILGGGPCWAAHPSDLAVCLAALDARIALMQGEQFVEIPLAELYARAAENPERETCLESSDVIEKIIIPARFAAAPQHFLKVTQRQAWDFALVSVAAVWPKRGRRPRIALGGVAPSPWVIDSSRLPTAPRRTARPATIELWAVNVAEQVLRGARALSQNGYKIPMAKAAVRRVLIDTFPTG
jgi:xanthine dehydrogenase YagS FAD-binding subunit